MRLPRPAKLLLVLLLFVAVALGAWFTHDWYRHRILVLLPDGSPAATPSVTLDYDPIYEYHPTNLEGRDGTIYIPRSRAYGRGWETMKIFASAGDKKFYARRYPTECSYPMTVTLEELPPAPPAPSKFEQAVELLKGLSNLIR